MLKNMVVIFGVSLLCVQAWASPHKIENTIYVQGSQIEAEIPSSRNVKVSLTTKIRLSDLSSENPEIHLTIGIPGAEDIVQRLTLTQFIAEYGWSYINATYPEVHRVLLPAYSHNRGFLALKPTDVEPITLTHIVENLPVKILGQTAQPQIPLKVVFKSILGFRKIWRLPYSVPQLVKSGTDFHLIRYFDRDLGKFRSAIRPLSLEGFFRSEFVAAHTTYKKQLEEGIDFIRNSHSLPVLLISGNDSAHTEPNPIPGFYGYKKTFGLVGNPIFIPDNYFGSSWNRVGKKMQFFEFSWLKLALFVTIDIVEFDAMIEACENPNKKRPCTTRIALTGLLPLVS